MLSFFFSRLDKPAERTGSEIPPPFFIDFVSPANDLRR